MDYLGAVLMAISLAGITIGLGTGTQMVGDSTAGTPVRWAWLLVAALAFTAFLLWERRTERPLIRLDLFKKPPFAAANIAHLLVGAALIIGMVEIPLYANTLFGLTEIRSGLLLIALTLHDPGWAQSSAAGSRTTSVTEPRRSSASWWPAGDTSW